MAGVPNTSAKESFYCFYGKHPFSHITSCSFAVDGSTYYCVDQFVKLSLLRSFGMYKIVHQLRDYGNHKTFIKSYANHMNKLKRDGLMDPKLINEWYTKNLKLCMKKAYRQVFMQNVTFKDKLLSTRDKCILFSQKDEKLMGINMTEAQFYIWAEANKISANQILACFGNKQLRPPYLGTNLVGIILMELRAEFNGEPAFKLPKVAESEQKPALDSPISVSTTEASSSSGTPSTTPVQSGPTTPARLPTTLQESLAPKDYPPPTDPPEMNTAQIGEKMPEPEKHQDSPEVPVVVPERRVVFISEEEESLSVASDVSLPETQQAEAPPAADAHGEHDAANQVPKTAANQIDSDPTIGSPDADDAGDKPTKRGIEKLTKALQECEETAAKMRKTEAETSPGEPKGQKPAPPAAVDVDKLKLALQECRKTARKIRKGKKIKPRRSALGAKSKSPALSPAESAGKHSANSTPGQSIAASPPASRPHSAASRPHSAAEMPCPATEPALPLIQESAEPAADPDLAPEPEAGMIAAPEPATDPEPGLLIFRVDRTENEIEPKLANDLVFRTQHEAEFQEPDFPDESNPPMDSGAEPVPLLLRKVVRDSPEHENPDPGPSVNVNLDLSLFRKVVLRDDTDEGFLIHRNVISTEDENEPKPRKSFVPPWKQSSSSRLSEMMAEDMRNNFSIVLGENTTFGEEEALDSEPAACDPVQESVESLESEQNDLEPGEILSDSETAELPVETSEKETGKSEPLSVGVLSEFRFEKPGIPGKRKRKEKSQNGVPKRLKRKKIDSLPMAEPAESGTKMAENPVSTVIEGSAHPARPKRKKIYSVPTAEPAELATEVGKTPVSIEGSTLLATQPQQTPETVGTSPYLAVKDSSTKSAPEEDVSKSNGPEKSEISTIAKPVKRKKSLKLKKPKKVKVKRLKEVKVPEPEPTEEVPPEPADSENIAPESQAAAQPVVTPELDIFDEAVRENVKALETLLSGLLMGTDFMDLARSCTENDPLAIDLGQMAGKEKKRKKKKKKKEGTRKKKDKNALKSVVSEVNLLVDEKRILYRKELETQGNRLTSAVVKVVKNRSRDRSTDRSRRSSRSRSRSRSRHGHRASTSSRRSHRSHSRSHKSKDGHARRSRSKSLKDSHGKSEKKRGRSTTRDRTRSPSVNLNHYAVHTAPVWSCIQDLVDKVAKNVDGQTDSGSTKDDIKNRSIQHLATLQRIKAMNFKYARQRSLRSCTPTIREWSRDLAGEIVKRIETHKRASSLGPNRTTTRFSAPIDPVGDDINELIKPRSKLPRDPKTRRPVTYHLEPGEVPPPWWVPPPAPPQDDPQAEQRRPRDVDFSNAGIGRMEQEISSLLQMLACKQDGGKPIIPQDMLMYESRDRETRSLFQKILFEEPKFQLFPEKETNPPMWDPKSIVDQIIYDPMAPMYDPSSYAYDAGSYDSMATYLPAVEIPWMSSNQYREGEGDQGSLMPKYVFGASEAKHKREKKQKVVSLAQKLKELQFYKRRWRKGQKLSTMARMGFEDPDRDSRELDGLPGTSGIVITDPGTDQELAMLRALYDEEAVCNEQMVAKLKGVDPSTVDWGKPSTHPDQPGPSAPTTGIVYEDTSKYTEWLSWYRQTHEDALLPHRPTEDSPYMPSGTHKEELRGFFKTYRTRLEDMEDMDPRFREHPEIKSAQEVGLPAPTYREGISKDGGKSYEAQPVSYKGDIGPKPKTLTAL